MVGMGNETYSPGSGHLSNEGSGFESSQHNVERLSPEMLPVEIRLEGLVNEPLGMFEQERSKDGCSGKRAIVTGSEPMFVFQGRTYAPSPEAVTGYESEQLWRMYLQVETEDIPQAVEMLKDQGVKRASEGKDLNFKYLYATWQGVPSQIEVGDFEGLEGEDPRIVVYFKDFEERRDFARDLVRDNYEGMTKMAEKRVGKARRPGTSVVYEPYSGRELRHINITDKPGYSEGIAEDPNWRSRTRGSPTTRL
jgi:hypothetical protein